jgi:hypothetical protein
MATDSDPKPAPAHPYSPLAAFLSYLVPGLGQISQGRVGKGVLFLVCLYGLFFYGMYLGEWKNVYIPESTPVRDNKNQQARFIDALTDRARFFGQFWIGAVAWPAIAQVFTRPSREEIAAHNALQPNDPLLDGKLEQALAEWRQGKPPHPVFGALMRPPDQEDQNKLLQRSDKKPDLGWMYTVIAGVLNILVIYDAFAGPAFGAGAARPARPSDPAQAGQEQKAPHEEQKVTA